MEIIHTDSPTHVLDLSEETGAEKPGIACRMSLYENEAAKPIVKTTLDSATESTGIVDVSLHGFANSDFGTENTEIVTKITDFGVGVPIEPARSAETDPSAVVHDAANLTPETTDIADNVSNMNVNRSLNVTSEVVDIVSTTSQVTIETNPNQGSVNASKRSLDQLCGYQSFDDSSCSDNDNYRNCSSSSDESSSSSDSEPDSDSDHEVPVNVPKKAPLRVKGEIGLDDLPLIEDLHISVPHVDCNEIGRVSAIVDQLVVVDALVNSTPVDIDTVLFLDEGDRPLGKVFDVLGQVSSPIYCVRFNSNEHVKEKNVTIGMNVYCALKSEHTSLIFLPDLLRLKGSDASWRDDVEPPPNLVDYSDDEQERNARRAKKGLPPLNKGKDGAGETGGNMQQRKRPWVDRSSQQGQRLPCRGSGPVRPNFQGPPQNRWQTAPAARHYGPAPFVRAASFSPRFQPNQTFGPSQYTSMPFVPNLYPTRPNIESFISPQYQQMPNNFYNSNQAPLVSHGIGIPFPPPQLPLPNMAMLPPCPTFGVPPPMPWYNDPRHPNPNSNT